MGDSVPRLVILGSSLTALAVARNAARLGMSPVIVDTQAGIAASTRKARVEIVAGGDEASALGRVVAHAEPAPAWLIATSDAWLRFLIAHRALLELRFAEILHPGNAVLADCLEKGRFARWCADKGIPAPTSYAVATVQQDPASVRFPVLVRPAQSAHASRAVPKAVEAGSMDELRRWLDVYAHAGLSPSITQSRLGLDLVQYSVGASRRGQAMTAIVAVKRRPLARQCAVGSYVELESDTDAEALATRALCAMDYHGIAEVEILRDRANGADYVIEINPRPWIQYGLAEAAGRDLLAFQLAPGTARGRVVTSGRRWMNLPADLYYCFSRSAGVVRSGEISVGDYIRSLLRANTFAHLALDDPAPAWRSMVELYRSYAGRRSADT
jgi:predicted ATP-grasp superfamily ATP-dependent carboligase